MIDAISVINFLVGLSPVALLVASILGTLVVLGQAIVLLTPSKSDDEAWAKLMAIPVLGPVLSALANFAVIQKK